MTTIVYQFLALNADEQDNPERQNELIDIVPKLLITRSVEGGSSDNITTIVIFLKDLAKISPSIKPVKENGHQNGHHLNGHHNELSNEQELTNGNKSFPLNINAAPFSPNKDVFSNDLFNNISMSGIESIRSLQEKAWNDCVQANINVTSNEDNIHDDLQCAINDEINCFNNQNTDEEQPHSILPDINEQLTEQQQFTETKPDEREEENQNDDDDDDELQRELDDERVIVNDESDDKRLDEFDEESVEIVEELRPTTEEEKQTVDETVKTVECEYGVIPSESTASPVDLISESTTTEHNEPHDEKSSNENLPNSPFEQIEEHQQHAEQASAIDKEQQSDVVIKVNDQTFNTLDEEMNSLKDDTLENEGNEIKVEEDKVNAFEEDNKPHEDEEKSEENSFEFIEISHQDLQSEASPEDQNTTQYESPENSNLSKLTGFQEEISVYENANPNFENSILNRGLTEFREQSDDDEEDDDEHPFENDSEDSIKYLDKTATQDKMVQVIQNAIESIQTTEINDLADLMQNANLDENNANQNESSNVLNINDQTLNLFQEDQEQENIDETNKENVPQLIKPQPTLLDTTLVFNGNPPNLIAPTSTDEVAQQLEQINEDHFNDENDENQQPAEQQHAASNFELIKDEELVNQDQTSYKQFDMDLTYCNKTEELEVHLNAQQNAEAIANQTVIDEKVPIQIENTEPALLTYEEDEQANEEDTTLVNNLDESSVYIAANQDSSFLNNVKSIPVADVENMSDLIEEQAIEESKDYFVVLESPPKESSNDINELNNDANNGEFINNDQISELKSDLIDVEQQPTVDDKPTKPEIVNETPKETADKSSSVTKTAVIIGTAAVAAVASSALATTKKKAATTTPTTSKQSPLNKAKLTKDTKPAVKDTKTTASTKSTTLVKKSVASTTAASKPSSTVTRKPLSASSKLATTNTVSSSKLVTNKTRPTLPSTSKSSAALTSKPAVSKVTSTLRSTVTSRLNTASSSTAAAAKPTTTTKPTVKSTTTTKPLTSKYANITSKVTSKITSSSTTAAAKPTTTTKPSSTLSTAKATTGLTKRPVSSTTARTSLTTTKPSTTANRLTNVTSKVSSIRSAATSTAQSKANSKPSTTKPLSTKPLSTRPLGTKPSSTTTARTTTTTTAAKKATPTTAVPRKPVSKQLVNSKPSTSKNANNLISKSNNSTPVVEPKSSLDGGQSTGEQLNNENSNSIKPNSQLVNGQSSQTNSNNLPNGDGSLSQSITSTSITSSKSRDKLTNSLKAELEAAIANESLPK